MQLHSFGKYLKLICILVFLFLSISTVVNGQTLQPSDKISTATNQSKAKADSTIQQVANVYNNATKDLQSAIGKTLSPISIKKNIDGAGRELLNKLAIKPSSFQLKMQQASTEMLLVPQEISKNMLSQTRISGSLIVGGITNQFFFAQQHNFFNNRGFTDFTYTSDITSKYKQMSESLGNGYASILTKTMQGELTQLKGLKDKIDQSLTKNIENLVQQATDLQHIIPASSLTEFNYENIIANKSNEGLEKLKAAITQHHGGDSIVTSKLKNLHHLLTSIEQTQQTYHLLKPDSTIAKYEELIKHEKEKMIAKPSLLRKFIKSNHLQGFNFNFLMLAKKIDIGSFFSPGSLTSAIKNGASGLDVGNITKGVQVILNNKNNVKLFLGDNITNRVDELWQPGSIETYMGKYQSTAPQLMQRLNMGLSIEDIKALGGININLSQQTSTPNLNNSFFGLTRKFSNFSISKKLIHTKIHQLSVDILSNITSYSKTNINNAKSIDVPQLSVEQKSLNYTVSYGGNFKQIDLEAQIYLNGSVGNNTPSNTGNYDRPIWNIEVFINKYFPKNNIAITTNFNSSKYNAGLAGNDLSFTNGLLNIKYSIDKKNSIHFSFRGNKNGSDALMSNSNYGFEAGHIASFKKRGLRYAFSTKVAALHQEMSFKSNKTGGWMKQASSLMSVRFPQNFSIQNTVDISSNTFANNTFLTGNRFTIAPCIEFQKNKYSFSTGFVYEQVSSYYMQAGSRNSFNMGGFLNKNLSLSASVDIRYNIKQYVPVFGNNLVTYGNMSIQYLIK